MDINFLRGKKGQVTLFVILAILIVALGLLIYFFLPGIISTEKSTSQEDPQTFLEDCIEDSLRQNIKTISENGGVMENEFYLNYSGEKYEYLCYTNEYYKRCVIQKISLPELFKKELEESISSTIEECSSSLVENFREKSYDVSSGDVSYEISVFPGKIDLDIDWQLTLEKGENKQNYPSFHFSWDSNLYQLLYIANNIVKWEEKEGGVEVTEYMYLYRDLKLRKMLVHNETTIYFLENKETGEKFNFASRSLIFPSGYI